MAYLITVILLKVNKMLKRTILTILLQERQHWEAKRGSICDGMFQKQEQNIIQIFVCSIQSYRIVQLFAIKPEKFYNILLS